MEIHDAANIFPLDEEHLDDLAADIKAHGQRVPIEVLGGKIIDGRRRFVACQKAGVEPILRTVDAPDPVAYVLSLNLHRRQLNEGQRSMVAARAREFYDQQAKQRLKTKGGHSGPVDLPEAKGDARDQAGKAVGVSGRSVDHASKVLKKGTPSLVKAVDDGRMAVSTAAILTSEPAEVQDAEATKPARKRRRVAGPNRARHMTAPVATVEEENGPGRARPGVGVTRANEAINCLIRIPKNDPLRKRGFQIVTDWIRHNR